jgi:hypothetical protein
VFSKKKLSKRGFNQPGAGDIGRKKKVNKRKVHFIHQYILPGTSPIILFEKSYVVE